MTIIDWGYKLVDGASRWVGDTFGEGAQKAFNGLLGVLKNFINAFLVWKIIGEKLVKALINSITRAFRIARIIVKKALRFAKKAIRFAKGLLSKAGQIGKNVLKSAGKWGGKALKGIKGVLKIGGKVGGKVAGKVGGFAAKIFGKAANFIAPAMKSAKPFVSKFFGRIPIIGPLVVGIVSIISGDPIGQALFKTIGAALGGALGTFIPIPILGTILGETIGVFVGDMLYTLMFGGGIKAVGEKLKQQLLAVLNAGKAVKDWIGGGITRFVENLFKTDPISIAEGWGRRAAATKISEVLGLKDWLSGLGYVENDQVVKFPNLLNLFLPWKFAPLLVKSFFPPGEEKGGEKPPAEVGAPEKDAGKEKDQSTQEWDVTFDNSDLISANQKNGVQGVIEKINSYAPYEEQGGPTIIKVPNPQTTPQTMGEAKAAGEPIIVPMVVSGGGDPYEDLDFFG